MKTVKKCPTCELLYSQNKGHCVVCGKELVYQKI